MTRLQKQAVIKLVVCLVVLGALPAIFFTGGGVEAFARDASRKLLLAAFLAAGYLAITLSLFLTRNRPARGRMRLDERDARVVRLANGVSVAVLGIYVFVLSIALYEGYQTRAMVPVGWMWFLAYSSSFLAIFSHAAATLALYNRMDHDGQG